jgi:hypothetical protein
MPPAILPTFWRAASPLPQVERFPDWRDLARRLHRLRAGRKLRLTDAFGSIDGVVTLPGWSVWAKSPDPDQDDEWLGLVVSGGFTLPPLREALAATAVVRETPAPTERAAA